MRQLSLFMIGLILLGAGCSSRQQPNTLTLVNALAIDANVLERVRTFAEDQLQVPVRAIERPALGQASTVQALKESAVRIKTDADVELIVLAPLVDETEHLSVFESEGVALINTYPLATDDAETFARRIERQVMRAAAFTFGMPPTPDPFCVTRDYRSLEDLDRMGRNYSPPWMGRFADEAARRGLEKRPMGNAPAAGIK